MFFHCQRGQSKFKSPVTMVMRALGAFCAVVFAISIPSIYFLTSTIGLKQALTAETAFFAKSIEKLVQRNPDLWELESVKLKEILSKPLILPDVHKVEIRTAVGKLVAKTNHTEARPVMLVSVPFFDSGQLAGTIFVSHSVRTIIIVTILLGIFSSFFGYLTYYFFRTYPIRKLETSLSELQGARDELEQRVADRTQALQGVKMLLEREHKQNELLSASPIIIYRCEPTNNFPATFITENIRNMLGYEPHEFTEEADFWASHIHPDDAPHVFSSLSFLFERGHHTHEYRFLHKNGTYRWIYDGLRLIYDNDDKPTDIVGSLIDITERKQVEEALTDSEARFKGLVESSSDMIWEIDTNGAYTYVSPKIRDLLGYEPEELIGRTPFDLMPPEEAKRLKNEFGVIATSQKSFVGLENTCIHKDGSLVVIETNGVPFFDLNEKYCGYRGIDRDTTERKRMEEAVLVSEQNFRALFEKSVHGILVLDLETNRRIYVNPSACQMFGYSETEFLQLGVMDIHPEYLKNFVISEFELQRRGEKPLVLGLPCQRKDGTVFYADISASPVKINDRECVMAFFADISERKALEDGLQKAYADLINLQTQLVQTGKLASIGELAAGVAHELNQPLMIIRTTAQLMVRKQSRNALETSYLLEKLNAIEKNTKRMMKIINHLRTFSRQSKNEYTQVSVNRIIQDSFLMIGEQLSLKDIEVRQDLSGDLPKIRGDVNQLEQVVLNLLANARDAIESKCEARSGGAQLKKKIVITTQVVGNENETVEILVKDTGSGMSQETLKSKFDPFYTTKEVGKGTGLGLSISYGIIQDHEGEIDVVETGAEGTTFRIRLPAV